MLHCRRRCSPRDRNVLIRSHLLRALMLGAVLSWVPSSAPCGALAQPRDAGGSADAGMHAEARRVRPEMGSPRRGPLPLPRWAVLAIGGGIALAAAAVLARAFYRGGAR